jgi:hypothetical protein
MTVKQAGGKFKLISRTGKTLGTHPTMAKAEAQEKAIQISKARAAGHRIPRRS